MHLALDRARREPQQAGDRAVLAPPRRAAGRPRADRSARAAAADRARGSAGSAAAVELRQLDHGVRHPGTWRTDACRRPSASGGPPTIVCRPSTTRPRRNTGPSRVAWGRSRTATGGWPPSPESVIAARSRLHGPVAERVSATPGAIRVVRRIRQEHPRGAGRGQRDAARQLAWTRRRAAPGGRWTAGRPLDGDAGRGHSSTSVERCRATAVDHARADCSHGSRDPAKQITMSAMFCR